MLSFIYLLFFIGTISARFKSEEEFEIKQSSLLNNGRSYTITQLGHSSLEKDVNRYTIQNELFSFGKKLILLENGRPIYAIKHKLGHLYQKWNIYDAQTDDTIGVLEHRPSIIHDSYKVESSKFGHFHISGNFVGRTFSIKKDGHKVAEIHKKHFHVHDTYSIKIEANQDPAIILLIAIGIDEIRQHL